MKINLSKMSLAELKSHSKDVQKAIVSFETRKRKDALAAAQAAAAEAGFTLADLVGGSGKSSKPARPAKYQNPSDASQTWSGRGRQPEWFKVLVASGTNPEDMLIA